LEANIDVDKMENVINNLIDNAIKYSYESVHIVINCDSIGNNIQINVADNGMGIPAQDLDSIFKNFRRGSQIERKRIFGYGIGLSFVKKVIQAHGGTIQASSKEGEGSVFNIKIPK
jgi:two-component system phosphate regulon sensor histidine kinase PhoR